MERRSIGEGVRDNRLGTEKQELDALDMHDTNLFDQDEDAAGQKWDEGTGKQIDNSTAETKDLDRLEVLDEDVLQNPSDYDKAMKKDRAAQWLADHDPKMQGKKKPRIAS